MAFDNEQATLRDRLRHFDVGTLVTQTTSGELHGRPMIVAQLEENGDLWFVTGLDTPKINEVRANEQVEISFQDRNERFVSVSGRATVIKDPEKTAQLWHPSFSPWFPQGQDDPNLVLIHVRVQRCEYWDNTGAHELINALDSSSSGY